MWKGNFGKYYKRSYIKNWTLEGKFKARDVVEGLINWHLVIGPLHDFKIVNCQRKEWIVGDREGEVFVLKYLF